MRCLPCTMFTRICTYPHLDTAVVVEQESEASRRQAQHSSGLPCVKPVDQVQAKVPLRREEEGGGHQSQV